MSKYLAVDLGAESGRMVIGQLEGDYLRLEEVNRFANYPVRVGDCLHWDVLRLWSEIKQGLSEAASICGDELVSVGLDTWGVDFGLLAADDTLLGNPYHYRDNRTNGMMELAFSLVPRAEIFERTGIQFMKLNSLYQLLSMVKAEPATLAAAKTFLNMPDLFNFWLSGRKVNEFTIATTSQCYDPRAGEWAWELLDKLGIPTHIFGDIVPPGTLLEKLRPSVAEEVGCGRIAIVAPATHDTASAVAAVPAVGGDYIYLSSGTWSVMGVEVDEPIITDQSLASNFTNEGGVVGKFRLLKNILGLWLVQESRREWIRQGEVYSYEDLSRMAAETKAFGPLVVPDDGRFLPPGDMPARIQAACRETGQPVPESKGAIVRCALESLALEYRRVAELLEELVGEPMPTIHIIGGGSQNHLLNQYTADATGRLVLAGPVEATSIGNLLVQAWALGHLGSLEDGRTVVRKSFEVTAFEPQDRRQWDGAYGRYLRLIERGMV